MSKKNNPKTAAPLSPENYIRQKARSLPIFECHINRDWQNRGLANIIVARIHKTGHITLGIYLVDLLCLGVKDAGYKFNISAGEYMQLLYQYQQFDGMMKTDYALVHNIIFESIAFADLYEFQPHKDFISVAQYILEDDDDEQVELISIECGRDGRPFYVRGPYEDDRLAAKIIAQLRRIAGPGGFSFANNGEEFNGFAANDYPDDDRDDEADDDAMRFGNEGAKRKQPSTGTMDNSQTYEMKIKLKGVSKPPVWRSITAPSHCTFADFHLTLQIAFGWENNHFYRFSEKGWASREVITDSPEEQDSNPFNPTTYLDPYEERLSDVFYKAGQKYTYIYDFGDNWEHEIELIKINAFQTDMPLIMSGKGKCPPEDCGGAPGYERLKQILADSGDPQHKDMLGWMGLKNGSDWRSDEFDPMPHNQSLMRLFNQNK